MRSPYVSSLGSPARFQTYRFLKTLYSGSGLDAKRSVIAALVALGLPVFSRVSEDPERGLAFEFLRSRTMDPVC